MGGCGSRKAAQSSVFKNESGGRGKEKCALQRKQREQVQFLGERPTSATAERATRLLGKPGNEAEKLPALDPEGGGR